LPKTEKNSSKELECLTALFCGFRGQNLECLRALAVFKGMQAFQVSVRAQVNHAYQATLFNRRKKKKTKNIKQSGKSWSTDTSVNWMSFKQYGVLFQEHSTYRYMYIHV